MTTGLFEVRCLEGRGDYVVVCDHATNFVPEELDNLQLTAADLSRHIAWDIGAAAVAEILSERFDSPLVMSGASRLVADCNRHPDAHDIMPELSDDTTVPGNYNLSETQKADRLKKYFEPYHQAVEQILDARPGAIFLSVHSMTECLKGQDRPWPISLSSYHDRTLVDPLLAALRVGNEFLVGDNQPYDLDPKVDFSTPYHALRRGLRHLQVEFRQDEIALADGQRRWATRFADALERSRARANPASR